MLKLFLLLNPVYVTLFWAIVLSLHPARDNEPKRFLSKFMAISCFLYISHLSYFLPLPSVYHYLDAAYQLASLLVYPLYYIYIRLLTTDDDFSWRRHYLILAAPILLGLIYLVVSMLLSPEDHHRYLYDILPNNQSATGNLSFLKGIYITCRITFLIQTIVYLTLSYRLIIKNKDKIQNFYSNPDESSIRKLFLINFTLSVSVVTGIILVLIGKEKFLNNDKMLIAPSIIFSLMLFIIGWLGNKQSQVITEYNDSEPEKMAAADEEKRLKEIRDSLIRLFEEEKVFLNKDLTLKDITRLIGSNRTYISNIINNDFGLNFCAFVNNYRVDHAKHLLSNNKSLKNDELAFLAGFGSEDSLQRSFQSKEGITLRKFKADIK